MTAALVTSPLGRNFYGPHATLWVNPYDQNELPLTLWQADAGGPRGIGPGGFYDLPGTALDANYTTPAPTKTIRDVNGVSYTQFMRNWVYFTLGNPDLGLYLPITATAVKIGIRLVITGDTRQEPAAIWFAARRPGAATGNWPTDYLKWRGAGQTTEEAEPNVYPVAVCRRASVHVDVRDWASLWVPTAPHPSTGGPAFEYAWGARVSTRDLTTLQAAGSLFGIAIGVSVSGWAR